MAEKPILFSTQMVESILREIKKQTRRLNGLKEINKKPDDWALLTLEKDPYLTKIDKHGEEIPYLKKGLIATFENNEGLFANIKSPWQPGDILWVKETWLMQSMRANDMTGKILFKAEPNDILKIANFAPERYERFLKFESKQGWQSSLFMPREAARILLKVTDVRLERLQDITEEDAIAEGFSPDGSFDAKFHFCVLWDYLNKSRGYGWNTNPWLWVIDFKKLDSFSTDKQSNQEEVLAVKK